MRVRVTCDLFVSDMCDHRLGAASRISESMRVLVLLRYTFRCFSMNPRQSCNNTLVVAIFIAFRKPNHRRRRRLHAAAAALRAAAACMLLLIMLLLACSC